MFVRLAGRVGDYALVASNSEVDKKSPQLKSLSS